MATITTTASLARQYNAFTGLSAIERSQSGIARAEVVYYATNDGWPAPGAGNNRIYTTGVIDLPTDFGYVLTDVFIKFDSASFNNIFMDAVGVMDVRVGGTLGPIINLELTSDPSRMNSADSTTLSSGSAYNTTVIGDQGNLLFSLKNKPTTLIYPFASSTYTTDPNPASQFQIKFGEEYQNGPAYDVGVYVRFLQYDIDQSYNYVVQSPQLTR